jgi:hypothetical protein
MPQYGFGSGTLFSVVEGANRTPRKFGTLQEVSVEFDFSTKKLHGQKVFPVAIGRGTAGVMIRAKAAEIYGRQWAEIVFGDSTVTANQRKAAVEEAGSIPTTPFTITVANAAQFLEDLGVVSGTTGLALVKVASAPTTGQYAVNASGVYTFAAADTGTTVRISYSYTTTGTGTGVRMQITNQLLGTSSFFAMVLSESYDSDNFYLKLNRCTAKKLSLATKLEDFIIPEFEAEAMADSGDVVGEIGFSDQ